MTRLCVLACSPRPGGNSDTAARLAAEAAVLAGMRADTIFLRDHDVRPCISCGFCLTHPGACALDARDEAGRLFAAMEEADTLLVAAPVYFYGPPAHLKALIDRAQRFWAPAAGAAPQESAPPRPALAALCAGRERGERLFEASLLILRCFLRALGRELASPLLLRGVDGPGDLAGRPDLTRRAAELGRFAASLGGIGPTP